MNNNNFMAVKVGLLKAEDERRISAFELWTWRRMLRVSWMEHKTNEWVRGRVGVREDDGLLNVIKRRKVAKCFHWKRGRGSVVLACIEGLMEGKNRIGHHAITWVDNLKFWAVGGLPILRDCAFYRQRPPPVAMV